MSSAPRSYVSSEAAPAIEISSARWCLGFTAILLLAAILFLARLGDRALWSSEFRWAEIAREMITTHNYFWPTINGRVYYDKPLGSYWLVVGSTYLTGGMNEAASRLPCAIAGVLAVAFLMLLVRRLYDKRTALLSGIILATSFSFVFFSRHASADVETLTGELAALLLFIRHEDHPDGWWVVGLWLIMAITSLTKGLLGFVLPLMTIGIYCVLADGWRELGDRLLKGPLAARIRWVIGRNRWLFNWKSILAIALGFAIYYAPFALSHQAQGSEKGLRMVWRENVVRFFRPFDHRGPIYLYVYVIFALMAPWAMLLPAALVEIHKRRSIGDEAARSDRFALVYFWATFAFFTLSGSRRSYYILPILPAAAIVVARLLYGGDLRSDWSRRLLAFGYGATAIAALGGIAILLPPSWILPGNLGQMPPAPSPVAFAIAWLLSAAGIVYAMRRYGPARAAVSVAITAYVVMAYIYVFAMPAADEYRGEKPFATQTLHQLGGDLSHVAFYRTQESLFYLNPPQPLPQYERLPDLINAIQNDGIAWVIVRRKDLPTIGVPTEVELSEPSFPWEDEEQLRNKVVLVKIESTGQSDPRS
ncbi:MAG: ArnT family glycosyltransferase [Candidatus Binataceae bacterium]